jgi:hypothetical protein
MKNKQQNKETKVMGSDMTAQEPIFPERAFHENQE